MNVRITSWNACGSGSGKITQNSGDLFSQDRYDILLLQEAGASDGDRNSLIGQKNFKFGQKEFKGFFKDDENATNKRCTTGILVETSLFKDAAISFCSLDILKVRRPIVFCTLVTKNFFTYYIATVHATARSIISKEELDEINSKFSSIKRATGWQWIIMGDFNVSPDILSKNGVPNQNILSPGEFTHINYNDQSQNKILDYAVASNDLANRLSVKCNKCFGTSDHIPVYTELEIV